MDVPVMQRDNERGRVIVWSNRRPDGFGFPAFPPRRGSSNHLPMLNRELVAPFVIVVDTPGGGLVVPVVSARVAAQAARHLSEYCPDIQAVWQISVRAQPDPAMVWGCAQPPIGQPRSELDAHAFLLAAGDSPPPVWTAICGYQIPSARFEALDPGMDPPCRGCQQQRWSALHSELTSLPVRSPGGHMHPQLRRPAVAARCGAGSTST